MSADGRVVAELMSMSDADKPHAIIHYLYVPHKEAADLVAGELQRRGYSVEDRLGVDGVNWLVLACHEIVPAEEVMMSLRESMTELVEPLEGEYDGWEVRIPRCD